MEATISNDMLVETFTDTIEDIICKTTYINCSTKTLLNNMDKMISSFVDGDKSLRMYIERVIQNASFIYNISKGSKGNDYLDDFINVFSEKQHDYGPYNIARFGEVGIIVRVSDKLERIRNLTNKKEKPKNESIADTLLDIVNYCVILLIVMDYKWQVECNHYKLTGSDIS